jgi:hypothetical protein
MRSSIRSFIIARAAHHQMCHGLIEHQLGGAVSRVGRDETAFNHRDLEYSFMSIGQCADAGEAEACIRWAREFWDAMQPHSTGQRRRQLSGPRGG